MAALKRKQKERLLPGIKQDDSLLCSEGTDLPKTKIYKEGSTRSNAIHLTDMASTRMAPLESDERARLEC